MGMKQLYNNLRKLPNQYGDIFVMVFLSQVVAGFLLLLGILDCDAAEAVCRLFSSMHVSVCVSY